MKSKYTEGGWVVERSPFEVYNVDHGALEYHVVSGDIMIAALYCDPDSEYANLIAAAPKVLEALEGLLNECAEENLFLRGCQGAARAVAKAKGQTND